MTLLITTVHVTDLSLCPASPPAAACPSPSAAPSPDVHAASAAPLAHVAALVPWLQGCGHRWRQGHSRSSYLPLLPHTLPPNLSSPVVDPPAGASVTPPEKRTRTEVKLTAQHRESRRQFIVFCSTCKEKLVHCEKWNEKPNYIVSKNE